MNRCDRCNVEVVASKFCPLCGRCVSDENTFSKVYPDATPEKQSAKYALRIVFGVLLLINFLAVALELIITKKFFYSWHIIVPSVLLYISVYFPIKKQWSLTGVFNISLFTVCGYIIFLELFTNTFGWGVYYVVPFVLLAASILSWVCMSILKFIKVDVQLPLITSSILALVNFLVVYLTKGVYWPSTVSMLTGFALVFILFVVKSRRAKKNLQKNFHV